MNTSVSHACDLVQRIKHAITTRACLCSVLNGCSPLVGVIFQMHKVLVVHLSLVFVRVHVYVCVCVCVDYLLIVFEVIVGRFVATIVRHRLHRRHERPEHPHVVNALCTAKGTEVQEVFAVVACVCVLGTKDTIHNLVIRLTFCGSVRIGVSLYIGCFDVNLAIHNLRHLNHNTHDGHDPVDGDGLVPTCVCVSGSVCVRFVRSRLLDWYACTYFGAMSL